MQADLGGTFTTNLRSAQQMMRRGGHHNDDDDDDDPFTNNMHNNNGDDNDDVNSTLTDEARDARRRRNEVRMGDPRMPGGGGPGGGGGGDGAAAAPADALASLFSNFIVHFVANGTEYVYLRTLRDNLTNGSHYLEVDFQHLRQFSETLARSLDEAPIKTVFAMELGAARLAEERRMFSASRTDHDIQIQIFTGGSVKAVPLRELSSIGVARLVSVAGIVVKASVAKPRCVRAMVQCTSCRHKMTLPGHRASELPAQCQLNQGAQGGAGGAGGGAGANANRQGRCRPNPYVLLPDQCEFDDQQGLKLQEPPEEVPTGELPRHVSIVVDRYHVGRITPGMRINVVGIISVQDRRQGEKTKLGSSAPVAGLRTHFIRALGIMHCVSRGASTTLLSINTSSFVASVAARGSGSWDVGDEAAFKAFARSLPYEVIARSIDPAVFGLQDPKRAIAALLFGGTRKRLDGNFLRGDINVLLIGDPSTAKSQLLKFTEQVAPIGLYTSGKGSSAAGLTASVIGSGAGDFTLEAGSMVLADGGVVCIDEFDKMREQDQVAIHEAMEQQTISIAKANMTTMLNSRTSVLAAANPTLGSYDPNRSNEEQLDFQSSILSRFDLIFKVLDPKDPSVDTRLAHHVIGLHKRAAAGGALGGAGGGGGGGGSGRGGDKAGRGGGRASTAQGASASGFGDYGSLFNLEALGGATAGSAASLLPNSQNPQQQSQKGGNTQNNNNNQQTQELPPLQFLTKYIAYARQTCFPSISEPAATALLDFFVKVRAESHKATQEALQASSSAVASTIQVTARQLESLVRVTEALARMRLDSVANISDAAEAIRLFTASTVDAIRSGVVEQTLTEAQSAVVIRIEEAIRNRVPMGATVQAAKLVSELHRLDFDAKLVERAMFAMTRREEIVWMKQRTLVQRAR